MEISRGGLLITFKLKPGDELGGDEESFLAEGWICAEAEKSSVHSRSWGRQACLS